MRTPVPTRRLGQSEAIEAAAEKPEARAGSFWEPLTGSPVSKLPERWPRLPEVAQRWLELHVPAQEDFLAATARPCRFLRS